MNKVLCGGGGRGGGGGGANKDLLSLNFPSSMAGEKMGVPTKQCVGSCGHLNPKIMKVTYYR